MNTINTQKNASQEEKERKEREEKERKERIKKIGMEKYPYYLRIANRWYKRCISPEGESVRERVTVDSLVQDFGKEVAGIITSMSPKYINEVTIPEHLNYNEDIVTPSGDHYYNNYRPLAFEPKEGGDFPHIRQLISHIFGSQEELGYDYVTLLYKKPMQKLPVLLLVSTENATGKSTFCNFLSSIFGDNAVEMTPETLRSKFGAPWLNKLLATCEETILDKREDYEKIKNLVTARKTPSESKGKDWVSTNVFVKFIFCSNNETNPVLIDKTDTRYWVIKVPKLTDRNPNEDFLKECEKEIPFFLYHLLHRELSTKGTDRLWFTPEETRTPAWDKIVAGNTPRLDKEIALILLEIIQKKQIEKVCYDTTTLFKLIDDLEIPRQLRISFSRSVLIDILKKWGLEARKKTGRYPLYGIDQSGNVTLVDRQRPGKYYNFSKSLLLELTK